MKMHSNRSGWVYTAAISWRVLAHRFSFALFLALSVGLLFLGHAKPTYVKKTRIQVIDHLSPILSTLSKPLSMIDSVTTRIQSYRSLLTENARLRVENALLVQWQNTALSLEHENNDLRSLLNYKAEPALSFISARVIANAGNAYIRSLIVTSGKLDGVKIGMAAMTGDGLIGRIVEVGDWTSRILLITDLNSRIPVMITGSHDQAILAGDNELHPKLIYLPQDSNVREGARVLTSGHGGIFPPNLPVGVITKTNHIETRVAPIASLGRINQIRLINFNLKGGDFNSMATQIQSNKSLR